MSLNAHRTLTSTTARVTSETFWPLGPRVERFGLNRHSKASVKVRLVSVLSKSQCIR